MSLGPTQLPIGRGSFLLSCWYVGLDPTEIPSAPTPTKQRPGPERRCGCSTWPGKKLAHT